MDISVAMAVVLALVALVSFAALFHPFSPLRRQLDAVSAGVLCALASAIMFANLPSGDPSAPGVEVAGGEARMAAPLLDSPRKAAEPIAAAPTIESASAEQVTPEAKTAADEKPTLAKPEIAEAEASAPELAQTEAPIAEAVADVEVAIDAAPAETLPDATALEEIRQAATARRWPEAMAALAALTETGADLAAFRAELEPEVLALVRPIPASDHQMNRQGYELLAALNPEETLYARKVAHYTAAAEQSRRGVLTRLKQSPDLIDGVTWLEHPSQPTYVNSRSTVYLYIGQRERAEPWLRMQVQYAAEKLLHVEKVAAIHDQAEETLAMGGFQREQDLVAWEWLDVPPTEQQVAVLRKLAQSRTAMLRFEGDGNRRDIRLTKGDKRAILDMLSAYEQLRDGA